VNYDLFLQPLRDVPLIVIDLETTGLDRAVDEPLEIAVIRIEHGEIVQRAQSLLFTERAVKDEAFKVHGIHNVDVQDAPPLWEVFGLLPWIEGALPVAYNAPFDQAILRRALDLDNTYDGGDGYDVPLFAASLPWIDPLVWIRGHDKFTSGEGRHTLSETCKRHGVPHHGKHRALGDAHAVAQLWIKLMETDLIEPVLGSLTAGELLLIQGQLAEKQEDDYQVWKALNALEATRP
jgi:DNA polymerase-3 subunit epsilon